MVAHSRLTAAVLNCLLFFSFFFLSRFFFFVVVVVVCQLLCFSHGYFRTSVITCYIEHGFISLFSSLFLAI